MRLVASLCTAISMTLPAIQGQDAPLTRARQQAIIDTALAHVSANYVNVDRTTGIEKAIRDNVRGGRYDRLSRLNAFLDALNRDLQSAGRDKHLRVIHNPRVAAQLRREAAGTIEAAPEFLAMLRAENFRLRRARASRSPGTG